MKSDSAKTDQFQDRLGCGDCEGCVLSIELKVCIINPVADFVCFKPTFANSIYVDRVQLITGRSEREPLMLVSRVLVWTWIAPSDEGNIDAFH